MHCCCFVALHEHAAHPSDNDVNVDIYTMRRKWIHSSVVNAAASARFHTVVNQRACIASCSTERQ